jgi:hypothetical protein
MDGNVVVPIIISVSLSLLHPLRTLIIRSHEAALPQEEMVDTKMLMLQKQFLGNLFHNYRHGSEFKSIFVLYLWYKNCKVGRYQNDYISCQTTDKVHVLKWKYSRYGSVAETVRIISLAFMHRKVLEISTEDSCYQTSAILIGRTISGWSSSGRLSDVSHQVLQPSTGAEPSNLLSDRPSGSVALPYASSPHCHRSWLR